MSHAVCCVPVAPLRMDPDHRSEMVSQLLFGECCIITLDDQPGWVKIVNKQDGYTGWCTRAQLQDIDESHYQPDENILTASWISEIEYNGNIMRVPFGSALTAISNSNISRGKNSIRFIGETWDPAKAKHDAKTIEQLAFTYLNTAYLWGGRSVFGIDCSGLTQSVYRFLNIPLLRDAQQQSTQGELVGFLQQARCGDLAFFDDEAGSIIHTGILLNPGEIIHAAGKVRIDKIDNGGIIDSETGQRTQKLRIIKRYL